MNTAERMIDFLEDEKEKNEVEQLKREYAALKRLELEIQKRHIALTGVMLQGFPV